MGKVNLRNRIKDSSNNESNPPKKNTDLLNQLDGSDRIISNQTDSTIPTQDFATNLNTSEPISNRLKKSFESDSNIDSQVKIKPEEKLVIGKNIRLEHQESNFKPPIKNSESGIFKDENITEDGNKLKSLFGVGTKMLFNKKDDNNPAAKVEQGLLDRFNVNKKMFYIAIGCATGASFLVITYLQSFGADKLFGSEMVSVLVANKDIAEKSIITKGDLARKDIPKKFVLANSIIITDKVNPSTYIGKIATTDLYENEQLTEKRIVTPENSPWLSPAVPVNFRAFTIPTKALSFVKPRDHVDVFVTLVDPADQSRKINEPILQDGLVLAVDGRYKVSSNDNNTSSGESVTVAVPNKIVNFFTLLQDRGTFQIVLRKDGDTTTLPAKYSVAQLEVMLNTSNIKVDNKVEHLPISKPVIKASRPKPEPVHFNPPPRPVYVAPPPEPVHFDPPPRPVYVTPPRHVYVAPKHVEVKKVIKPHLEPVVIPKTVSVTVINGTSVSQHNVVKQNAASSAKPK